MLSFDEGNGVGALNSYNEIEKRWKLSEAVCSKESGERSNWSLFCTEKQRSILYKPYINCWKIFSKIC